MKLGGKKDEKTLLIVDGSHLSYKAFSTQELTTKAGMGTGAVFGTLRSLSDVIGQLKPDYCIALYDRGRNAKRKALFEAYKENKETDPVKLRIKQEAKKEFHRQVEIILDILPLLNIYAVGLNDQEADDGAAVISSQYSHKVVLFSGDKDWIQLVSPNVGLWDKNRNITLTPDNWNEYVPLVEKDERIHVAKESWILYRAIVGDSSDKIKGVPGLGPMAAYKMVEGCSTKEQLYAKADANKSDTKFQKLMSHKAEFETYLKVMDLSETVRDEELCKSCMYQLSDSKPRKDIELFKEKCTELEFFSIAKTVHAFANRFRTLNT